MEKEKTTIKSSTGTPQIEVVAVGGGAAGTVGALQRRNRRNRSQLSQNFMMVNTHNSFIGSANRAAGDMSPVDDEEMKLMSPFRSND